MIEVWNPTPEHKMILNLPATVECATPNIYADQIEWFGRHINRRDSVIIQPAHHNDRGTGVAATELGLMAGADPRRRLPVRQRRAYRQRRPGDRGPEHVHPGLDPQLDFSDIDGVRKVVEECNQIQVHPRHPYVGDLDTPRFRLPPGRDPQRLLPAERPMRCGKCRTCRSTRRTLAAATKR